jgi:hypothetical protein
MQNVAGLTIVNSTTGQSRPSTCPGNVRFHNPSGAAQTYAINGGIGTQCSDSSLANFNPLAPSSHAPGSINLTVINNPIFVQDSLIFTPSTLLAGRTAPIGGIWADLANTIRENAAGTGVHPGANGPGFDSTCMNLGTPPNPDYSVEATLTCTDAISTSSPGIILHATSGPNAWYQLKYIISLHKLRLSRVHAGTTFLAEQDFTLGTAGTPVVTIKLQYNAGTLHWWIAGVPQTPVVDSVIPGAGNAGIIIATQGTHWPDGTFITDFTATAL